MTKNMAFQISVEDVALALGMKISDPEAQHFFDSLNQNHLDHIERVALFGKDLDEQTSFAYSAIRTIFIPFG